MVQGQIFLLLFLFLLFGKLEIWLVFRIVLRHFGCNMKRIDRGGDIGLDIEKKIWKGEFRKGGSR